MSQRHYRSPFGDTTFTKVFVGGLAWKTPTDVMRSYFEQFGEILEAVIINDKNTGKSKGYGFVTFRDPESAARACADPNPVIDGRRANCNIASWGLPRPSPPRGRTQLGNLQQGGGVPPYASLPAIPPPPLPPPTPVIYRPYGYSTYPPDYGYHQTMYSPPVQQSQHYNHLYGGSSSAIGSPYFYGYSFHAPRGPFSMPPPQRYHGPSYLYYQTGTDPSAAAYSPLPLPMQTRIPYTTTADSTAAAQTQTQTQTQTQPQADIETRPVSSITTST